MKKSLVVTLALVFVLGIAGTAFAAANPFVDVPAKHWAYDAVAKLANAGVVDGYNDGTFRGDKTMTRYEMAQIVAKAMVKSEKADAETKALVDKLAVEFNAELQNLGVRVAKLEAKSDNVKFTGHVRARYINKTVDDYGVKATALTEELRTRLTATGQINEDWQYAARFEATENFLKSGADNTAILSNAYATGPIAGTKATLGRFDFKPGYGVIADSTVDGVKVEFGSALKASVIYGKEDNKMDGENVDYTGVELKYGLDKKTNLFTNYNVFDVKHNDTKLNIWEIGFDTKLNDDFVLKASYEKADSDEMELDGQDTGYFVGLDYKGANYNNVGSYGAWVNYRNFEDAVVVDSTLDLAAMDKFYGAKGYEVGFAYVPAKNIKFSTWYVDVKNTVESQWKADWYRAQFEFVF